MINDSLDIFSKFECVTVILYSDQTGAGTEEPKGEEITTNWDEAVESFDAMNLHDNLLRGIYAYGFEKPSAIQQRAIKPMSMGRDIIAQAQSGTGKTATFAVGILQMLDPTVTDCQSLVLAPTRELAQQIVKVTLLYL